MQHALKLPCLLLELQHEQERPLSVSQQWWEHLCTALPPQQRRTWRNCCSRRCVVSILDDFERNGAVPLLRLRIQAAVVIR